MNNTVGEKSRNRRGQTNIAVGATLLVFGALFAIGWGGTQPGMSGVAIIIAVAGLVTALVGIGRRRER